MYARMAPHLEFKVWKLNTRSGPAVLLEARGEV